LQKGEELFLVRVKMISRKIFARTVLLAFLLGVSLFSPASAENALKVTVSIVPQKYFVQKVAGALVDVSVMVLPGASPATYEPKPQQMVDLTRSKIYFAMGVPFEKVWLRKFARINSKMMIVHTEDGIEKIPMKESRRHDEKRHSHGVEDPHVWLSPPLGLIQTRNILDAFLKIDPARGKIYKSNYRTFVGELVDLDLKIRDVFAAKTEGTHFMVYHSSWGYFAKSYGLREIAISVQGKEPTPKELQNLIRQANEKNVKVIFVQPQFSTKSANTVAKSIGAQLVVVDPLEENWAENLLNVAEKFKTALR
jgi:zinc transport system substrate-binding protein